MFFRIPFKRTFSGNGIFFLVFFPVDDRCVGGRANGGLRLGRQKKDSLRRGLCPAKHYLDGLDFLPPGASGFCVSGQRRPAATQARHKRSAKAKPESCALKKTMTAADAFCPGIMCWQKRTESGKRHVKPSLLRRYSIAE
jgi:hypothetical protein